jgi:hypothetical protein
VTTALICIGNYRIGLERGRQPSGAPRACRVRVGRAAVLSGVVLAALVVGSPAALAAGGTTLTINVVPTTLSLTVSPGTATFGSCSGGAAPTTSTSTALGFPNGECLVGDPESDSGAPITITNTGVAADIEVNGTSAGNENGNWGLCNGDNADSAVICSGTDASPGANQYEIQNFVNYEGVGATSADGITGATSCDTLFDFTGAEASFGCSATSGQSQSEGLLLIGPESTSDTDPSWGTSVTWTAVAS